MISLIYAWMNGLVNIREAGDLRRIRPHYDVPVMLSEVNTESLLSSWIYTSMLQISNAQEKQIIR